VAARRLLLADNVVRGVFLGAIPLAWLTGLLSLPLYVALLALLARSPRLAAGAITWWVATHVKGLRGRAGSPASRLASLPALLALDAVASVSLLEGSIRHRTVVL
jgi:hypothetical protein